LLPLRVQLNNQLRLMRLLQQKLNQRSTLLLH
jgi:hypothetical protein